MALDTERYWDRVGSRIGTTRESLEEREHTGNLGAVARYKRRRFLEALTDLDVAGLDVLEIGHGAGGNCERLHGLGAKVRGVDISAQMVALATARNASWAPPGTFTHAPGGKLPFPDASFDRVLTVTVLQHNVRDEDVVGVAKELRRVLRPGGRAICFEDTLTRRRDDFSWVGRTHGDYAALFADAGLSLSRFRVLGLSYFWAFNRLRRIPAIHRPFLRATEETVEAPAQDAGHGEGQRVRGARRLAESVAVAVTRPVDRLWSAPEGLGIYTLRRSDGGG